MNWCHFINFWGQILNWCQLIKIWGHVLLIICLGQDGRGRRAKNPSVFVFVYAFAFACLLVDLANWTCRRRNQSFCRRFLLFRGNKVWNTLSGEPGREVFYCEQFFWQTIKTSFVKYIRQCLDKFYQYFIILNG